MIDQMHDTDVVETVCDTCDMTFMQGVEDTYSICLTCENFEPLDFDDWEE